MTGLKVFYSSGILIFTRFHIDESIVNNSGTHAGNAAERFE